MAIFGVFVKLLFFFLLGQKKTQDSKQTNKQTLELHKFV